MSQGERIGAKLFDYLEPIAFVFVCFSQTLGMRRACIRVVIIVCSNTPIAFRILA